MHQSILQIHWPIPYRRHIVQLDRQILGAQDNDEQDWPVEVANYIQKLEILFLNLLQNDSKV